MGAAARGSSPLARGTHGLAGAQLQGGRFIPARAGNTPSCSPSHGGASVHPRSRGEHAGNGHFDLLPCGSSPLARGTPPAGGGTAQGARFIPARAGNTILVHGPRLARPVHPRSRGEHTSRLSRPCARPGSSPLARGTRRGQPPRRVRLRFIPARAGNTYSAARRPRSSTVHPRSRGEHGRRRSRRVLGGRFIPARAGNTGSAGVGAAGPAGEVLVRPPLADAAGDQATEPDHHGHGHGADVVQSGEPPQGQGPPQRARGQHGGQPPPAQPVTPRQRSQAVELHRVGWGVAAPHAARIARWPGAIGCGSSPLARGTLSIKRASGSMVPVHPRSRGEH